MSSDVYAGLIFAEYVMKYCAGKLLTHFRWLGASVGRLPRLE
jgi:hypothetical protein